MAYATYEYYTSQYQGSLIPSSDFNELEARAEEYLNAQILINISTVYPEYPSVIPECLSKCVCRLAELAYIEAKGLDRKIASESSGNYSRSFEASANKLDYMSRLRFYVNLYLGKTGLLYRGL